MHLAAFYKTIRTKLYYELFACDSCTLMALDSPRNLALGPRKFQQHCTVLQWGKGIRSPRWRHGKGSRWVVEGGWPRPPVGSVARWTGRSPTDATAAVAVRRRHCPACTAYVRARSASLSLPAWPPGSLSEAAPLSQQTKIPRATTSSNSSAYSLSSR